MVVNESTITALSAQVQRKSYERVVIDFEHNSQRGHPNFEKPPRFHAGYGTVEAVPGEGVFLSAIEWTPSGKQYAREYSDLSPAVQLASGVVLFLNSVALCPNGAVHDLTFFSADANNNNEGETVMEKFLAAVRKGLGLAETATDADVEKGLSVIAVLSAAYEDLKGKLTALTAKVTDGETKIVALSAAGDKGEAVKIVTMLTTDVTALKTSVTALQSDLAQRDRDAVCLQARYEGKVLPLTAEQISVTDLKTLRDMVTKLPVTVPLSARTPGFVREAPAGDANQVTDLDRKVAKQCGQSIEDYAKANGLKLVGLALVIGSLLCGQAFATALTADRETSERSGQAIGLTAASNLFYAGSMVCISSGKAVPAADASGYVCVGKAEGYLDNTAALYSATRVLVARRGVFRWVNGGSFTDSDIGSLAYVSDDQTVTTAAAATYDIVAGIIVDVDSDGVWVDSYAIGGQGAASVTTWTASGNGSVGGTLAVTGRITGSAGLTVTGASTNNGSMVVTNGLTVGGAATVGTSLGVGTTFSAGTTVTAGTRYYLGTNGYFQIVAPDLQFVGYNGFTNTVISDYTQ